MSTLNVDKVDPSTGTALEIGSSGDTITIPSGATIVNSGTATGFGAALTGSTNNQVTTVTAANAITGETNFIYDGTIVGAGADGANADLGVGLHIKTADSGAGVLAGADELIIEGSGDNGISILTGTGATSRICFGDSGGANQGIIDYSHGTDSMRFKTADTTALKLHWDNHVSIGSTSDGSSQVYLYGTGTNLPSLKVFADTTSYADVVTQVSCSRDTSNETYTLYRANNGGGTVMACYDSGDIDNTNNAYGALSDERIKQDIADASSQWDDIKALKVRKFKLKRAVNKDGAENTPYHLGVIAQEVEAAGMNRLVKASKPQKEDAILNSDFGTVISGTADNGAKAITDEDDNITGYEDVFTEGERVKGVKYSILYMKAIKALQESMDRIEQLETKVTALENA
jgi:hypothetical protein